MSTEIQNKGSIYLSKPWLASYTEGDPHQIDIPSITIFDILEKSAYKYPTKIAVVDGERELTFSELKNISERVATALYKRGFRKGDCISIMVPNCLEYVIAFFSIQRLGGIVVQVNPNYQPAELDHILRNSESKGIIAFRDQMEKLEKIGLANEVIFILADQEINEEDNLHHWIATETSELLIRDVQPEDVAYLAFTSGTTGRPKGVMISHSNLVSMLYIGYTSGLYRVFEKGEHCNLGFAPLYHGMGLYSLIESIFIGGRLYLIDKFDMNYILEMIRKQRPTIFYGSPTMYIALLNHPDLKKDDLTCFQFCICGSSPLPIEVIKKFEEITGAPMVEAWGLSEATTGVTRNPIAGIRKVGSTGIPMVNLEVKIVDIATGTMEMPIGEPGEIIVKGPIVTKGYWKNPEETEKTIRDGWLHTGDIGTMDSDGYFYIVGRKKELIITGGFNVYPAEVEDVIYQHPAVLEAGVYGVPDSYRGETIKAAIVLKKDAILTAEEIQDWCRERITRYKVPRIIEFRESLPKTAVGKILRRQLRDDDVEKNNQ
ncbi:long-chain-fatty-acid--CoA ligase [Neobacillus niacini]|uniref:long-chain-fatty-acid--CoA ligase n=1 Tax=Neobacillus niacini TaxID=86668 RepID=UPI0005F01697|nr:long-chain fatty acid--CoA ligase [Neobacillus niacini]